MLSAELNFTIITGQNIRESQNDFNHSHKGKGKEARVFVEILVIIENSVEEGNFFFKLFGIVISLSKSSDKMRNSSSHWKGLHITHNQKCSR